jgi:hypothetical protein
MIERVLTGFSELGDDELDEAAANAVTGLKGNTAIVFAGSTFTDFQAGAGTYHDSLGALKTGGKTATTAKNLAREALLPLFSAVAIVVNQQAAGNLLVLQTTGIPLAAHKEHHQQPLPINFQVGNAVNGNMVASVKHSPAGDHGTVFAFTPATNTNTNPNTWTLMLVNGHKATITGLTPGTAYLFTCAYKGLDDEALVWAPPVNRIVSN